MQIDFNKDYQLENEKVLLRRLTMADRDNLKTFSLNEPTLWKYSLQGAAGEDNLVKYIQIAEEGWQQHKEYPFIVFDKRTQQYAGSTRFYDIQPTFDTLQLGYTWYGKNFQGTKLNKNCKYLLLEFAFETLGAMRVEFRADNENERSKAAMRSIGCKVEGILRSNMPKPDGIGRRDSIVLSILRDEWFGEVKANLFARI